MDKEERISSRQATRMFLLATAAPIIRLVPTYTAMYSKRGALISGIIALGICIIVSNFFAKMFSDEKLKIKSMDNAFERAYGKIVTKILLALVLITQLLIIATRLRVFTERIQTIVFTDTVPSLLIISFISIALVSSKIKLKFLGRYAELLEVIFAVVFVIVIAIAMQNFDITNLYPVTIYDLPGVMYGAISFIGIMGLYGYVFYLGESISEREELRKYGRSAVSYFCLVGIGLILITVGSFGYRVVGAFSQPFFMALKNSNVLGLLEGIEGLFVMLWTIADFAMVIYNLVISGIIIKKIFNLESRATMISPLVFVTYMLSFALSKHFFMISQFTIYILIPLNIFLGILLPVTTYFVLKVKNRVNAFKDV